MSQPDATTHYEWLQRLEDERSVFQYDTNTWGPQRCGWCGLWLKDGDLVISPYEGGTDCWHESCYAASLPDRSEENGIA